MENGNFRKDLYYRLNVISISIGTANGHVAPAKDTCIESIILKTINDNTHPCSGIGRVQINNYLKLIGIHMGDANLHTILQKIQKNELITISKGRKSTKITKKGLKKLYDANNSLLSEKK